MHTKNDFGNNDIENRVAEKLKSFVVVTGTTSMCQRLLKQVGVIEFVAQCRLEPALSFGRHDL